MADKKIILYAEDNEGLRNTTECLLGMKFKDLDVQSFEDGSSLDERLRSGNLERVCAIITDNDMPGVQGSEIIKRYSPRYPDIPFILYYGGEESIGETALQNGAFAYVPKNSGLKNFCETLQRGLEKQKIE